LAQLSPDGSNASAANSPTNSYLGRSSSSPVGGDIDGDFDEEGANSGDGSSKKGQAKKFVDISAYLNMPQVRSDSSDLDSKSKILTQGFVLPLHRKKLQSAWDCPCPP